MNPDEELDLGEVWNPSPEEFARYRAREIELAKANCEFLAREHGMAAVKASNTLHTRHTIRETESVDGDVKVIVRTGKTPHTPEEAPTRVALGSFTAGFQAFLATRVQ